MYTKNVKKTFEILRSEITFIGPVCVLCNSAIILLPTILKCFDVNGDFTNWRIIMFHDCTYEQFGGFVCV